MSHELNPKDRERALQETKLAIDAAVPIFADIARSCLTLNELSDQLEQEYTKNSAVVELDGDYFEVREETTQKGTSHQYTTIHVDRLMPNADRRDYYVALLSYYFSSDPSFRVITRHHTTKSESGSVTKTDTIFDKAEDALTFFSQMYSVDEHGVVHPNYSLVDKTKADKLMAKHRRQLALEYKIALPENKPKEDKQKFGRSILGLFKR